MHSPSKVTQMIFAVLEDWYHHIVLTQFLRAKAATAFSAS